MSNCQPLEIVGRDSETQLQVAENLDLMYYISISALCDDFSSSENVSPSQANTKHLYNICTTSAQRLRCWSKIVQILYKCFMTMTIILPR